MSTDSTISRITIAVDDHGRPVARKHGDQKRLADEARMLALVQVPGVVTLLAHDPLLGQLDVAWTGGQSLTDPPARHPAHDTAHIVGRLAAILVTVHDAGVVHGRIEPSHVLVTDDGPVLTGFAEATTDGDPAHDVASLGRLIETLLGPATVPGRPTPTRSGGAAALSRLVTRDGSSSKGFSRPSMDAVAVGLRRLARRAQDTNAASACTLDEFRSTISGLMAQTGDESLSTTLDVRTATWRESLAIASRRRAVRTGAVAVGVAVGVAVIVAGAAMVSPGSPSRSSRALDTPVSDEGSTGAGLVTSSIETEPVTTSTPLVTEATTGGALNAEAELVWPVASATPADTARFTLIGSPLGSGIVEAHGVRYRVASDPQDRWLSGDWDCDSIDNLAILHVPSGALDVFESWPTPGSAATSKRVALVASAVEIRATTGECPELALFDASGNPAKVVTL